MQTDDFARRGALIPLDAPAVRLRGSYGSSVNACALLGRRVPGVTPSLPGTPLPAHRRILTT